MIKEKFVFLGGRVGNQFKASYRLLCQEELTYDRYYPYEIEVSTKVFKVHIFSNSWNQGII